ncbi:MAG TPA: enoyl-CoA hydratase-related protein [Syntrophales bacterium]|nr:enoyl-CoA hydratase-related protein [Syntrophales bacterium]
MKYDNIILEKADRVAVLRLNRPAASNALNSGLFEDFIKALEVCTVDAEIKVIVITGEGKAFCAGGDVAVFSSSPDPGETIRQLTKQLYFAISGIRRIPKPVIAMINGAAAGAGISLAAACDLRICASSVKFRQAYTSIGLVPDGAWTLLVPLLIGFGKASELAYLDPIFDAKEAFAMGLVNRVVEDNELERTTRQIALKLARGAALSYAAVKENLNEALLGLLERMLELERGGIIRAGKTKDAREGISAFMERRQPSFSGQ